MFSDNNTIRKNLYKNNKTTKIVKKICLDNSLLN